MSLSDLPASELARIDAVCLEYESKLRLGENPPIADLVSRHGGSNREILKRELELVRDEISRSSRPAFEGLRDSGEPDGVHAEETIVGSPPITLPSTVELPSPGTRLGPYVISGELGRGGMGVVFAAVDTRLDRRVAIKVLSVEVSKRQALTERFEREARAVAAISHPNIVELFDVGVFHGLPYAVMEFLDGEPLDAKLARGPMEPQEVRQLGAQIAEALATAHEAKVIHRDLKPQNVMLVPRSVSEIHGVSGETGARARAESRIVKLFDFGLSRAPDLRSPPKKPARG